MLDSSSRKSLKDRSAGLLIYLGILATVILVFSILSPDFLSWRNINNILSHLSIVAISALGYTYVLIVGHMDMSFYMTACFGSMTMSFLVALGMNAILSILIGMASGGFFGFIAGYFIGKYKLPDIIVTIAVGFISYGCAYLFSKGAFIFKNYMTSGILLLNEARFLGIAAPTLIMLLLFFASYLFLEKTTSGRKFYATGSSPVAAYFSGIKVARIVTIAFIACSVFATLSASITNASAGRGTISAGISLLLPSISASFLGFAIMRKPSVAGTFLGTLLTSAITNGFILLNVPFYYGDMITSALLIISLAATYWSKERSENVNVKTAKLERVS